MVERKKKTRKQLNEEMPDRVYIKGFVEDFGGTKRLVLDKPTRTLDRYFGGESPVGEYILVRTGTTKTLLGDLEEKK